MSHTQAVPFLSYQSCQRFCRLPCMPCLLAHNELCDQQDPIHRVLAYQFQAKDNMLIGSSEGSAALVSARDASSESCNYHLVFRCRIFASLQQCIPSQGYEGYFCFVLSGVLRHRNLRAIHRHGVHLRRLPRLYSRVAQFPHMNDSLPCDSRDHNWGCLLPVDSAITKGPRALV